MIQRIQTIYLLTVTVLFILMLFFPYATFVSAENEFELSFRGTIPAGSSAWQWTSTTAWLSLLNTVIPVISLITVNLYRHRILQIRMSIFNIMLMLGFYGLFFTVKALLGKQYEYDIFVYGWTLLIPLIAAILTYFAIRAIAKDETLVRSLDRIR
ncbi:MAG: DUF4293 domain-containing protein [Candidatus Aphodosoma sp.]